MENSPSVVGDFKSSSHKQNYDFPNMDGDLEYNFPNVNGDNLGQK